MLSTEQHYIKVKAKQYLLPKRLAFLLSYRSPIQIVQIGSNDGKTGDPIHALILRNPFWRALFVEPVPYLFEKLVCSYPDQTRFICENVAIDAVAGRVPFFHVDPIVLNIHPNLPEWVEQLGSFNRLYVAKHFPDQIKDYIVETQVTSSTFTELLARHSISRVDFLHIDTEGHDYKVLKQVNFCQIKPRVVLFEFKHLCQEDHLRALELMRRSGYKVERWGGDYLCVKNE